MKKTCKTCNKNLPLSSYTKSCGCLLGVRPECNNCRSSRRMEEFHVRKPLAKYQINKPAQNKRTHICTYENHAGERELPLKQFRMKAGKPYSWCKVCEKNVNEEYKKTHREEILAKRKASRSTKAFKEQRREYDNRTVARRRRWEKLRRRNPMNKLKANLRGRLGHVFKHVFNAKKSKSTFEMIGLSPAETKAYIESKFTSGMNWSNYGKWHIDHIIPLSSAKTEEDMIKLCHYTNLQPLWAFDNISKGNKIPHISSLSRNPMNTGNLGLSSPPSD